MAEKQYNTKVSLTTTATDNRNRQYKFNIEFYIFAEGDRQIAYCPSLDLSTSGASFNDAAFYECFQLYIETCVDNGTLFDDLVAHGWKITQRTLRAPAFSTLLKKPELKHLVNSGIGFEKIVAPAQIAMA